MALPPARNSEWMPNGAQVRVCGWGNTSTGIIGNYPDTLKCVEVNIIRNSVCNDRNHYNGSILSNVREFWEDDVCHAQALLPELLVILCGTLA